MGEFRRKFLIIEDKLKITTHLKYMLEKMDHGVVVARNGKEALKLVDEAAPDIIFLSSDMNDMPVARFCEAVLRNPAKPFIVPVCFQKDENFIQLMISQGVKDLVFYPFNSYELIFKIKNLTTLRFLQNNAGKECDDILLQKEKAESEKKLLSKYFSKDLIEGILNGDISTNLGGEVKTASILFCDLRNSTGIAETVEPDVFFRFLNGLLTDLTDIIYGENGSVNKFLGDGILATFGCPRAIEDDAMHCISVAVKIRKYFNNFNQFRPSYLTEPIQMGVGVARGKLFIGNIGSVNQIEYTVLGDPVNIASRLESLTKLGDVDILMEENIYREVKDRVRVKPVKFSGIRGKIKEVKVFYLEEASL
ncbi:MAG: response regulator [Spirochaetales bacterium]|nr:response regulator [Spirochaetales bacterium]